MQQLKLMIVVGTRPEIIRLSEVIKTSEHFFDVVLVHTGQNYDRQLSEVFFDNFALRKPDYYLESPGAHLGEMIGNIISRAYEVMQEEQPDALLVLGDTNSCLAAYSAKRLKIPIFHMEAGNRCFDFRVPEEINRRVVDHLADINLTYTENARRYLIAEGQNKDFVYVTGSPMTEVLEANRENIEASDVLERLQLEPGGYFVVSMHREENIDDPERLKCLVEALNEIAREYKMPLVLSAHPRTRIRLESREVDASPLVRIMAPFDFFDYIKLEVNARCVLSDSGTLPEEAAILNFPAVVLRDSTERPEALDAGVLVIGGLSANSILQSIQMATGLHCDASHNPVNDYRDSTVSKKVAMIIQSYVKIVNERTWHHDIGFH